MPDCPECGATVPPKGRFCPDCGTDLASYMDNPDEFPSKRKQRDRNQTESPAGDTPSQRTPQDTPGQRTHQNHGGQQSHGTAPSRDQYGDQPPQGPQGQYTQQPPEDRYNNQPTEDQYGRPGAPAGAGYGEQPVQARPDDHKLLIGTVLTLAAIGLVEGAVQALYPEVFLEFIEQEQFGLEGELTAEIFLITGILGVIVSLLVIGVTVYFYREGYFRKAYFWLLLGSGVAGFFLVGSLFLTILVAFGIYGLVSVMK